MLEVSGLVCGYSRQPVLKNISFTVEGSKVLCLLGPNGSGKTTLFKTLLGLLPPLQGEVRFAGEDLSRWSQRRRARAIAYIPQSSTLPFAFSVQEVVLMGRTAHIDTFATPSPHDRELAQTALERLNIVHLRQKVFTELSGGERQMVLVARALAQEPRLLVMDEPTSSLDFSNQYLVLERVCRLAEQGMAVIMSSHHPSHAFLHANQVMLLGRDGRMDHGTPDSILTEDNLRRVYGINVKVANLSDGEHSRLRFCIPLPD
ncbi:MAG TPA: ABC transporter ATP-binding protein [Patescibacteria group bacterium]|nr:ABC transporter ATP-binding protein [Patescibacteria group bacterium]